MKDQSLTLILQVLEDLYMELIIAGTLLGISSRQNLITFTVKSHNQEQVYIMIISQLSIMDSIAMEINLIRNLLTTSLQDLLKQMIMSTLMSFQQVLMALLEIQLTSTLST